MSASLAFGVAICCVVVLNSIGSIVNFGLGSAEIAIGVQYLGSTTNSNGTTFLWCQVQHYIPIYLIVNGAASHLLLGLLLIVLAVGMACKSAVLTLICFVLIVIVSVFSLAWLIAGSVWIYSIKTTFSSDPSNPDNYCQPTLYWFAFWVTTVSWIVAAIQWFCQGSSRKSNEENS